MMSAKKSTNDHENHKENYSSFFYSALEKAAMACDIAGSDILESRRSNGRVDTKTLKELASTLKDISGLSGDQTREPLTVVFSSEAERYGI